MAAAFESQSSDSQQSVLETAAGNNLDAYEKARATLEDCEQTLRQVVGSLSTADLVEKVGLAGWLARRRARLK
jgi:hypothetical protein